LESLKIIPSGKSYNRRPLSIFITAGTFQSIALLSRLRCVEEQNDHVFFWEAGWQELSECDDVELQGPAWKVRAWEVLLNVLII